MRRFLFVSLLVGCASTPGPNAGPTEPAPEAPAAAPSEQTFGQALSDRATTPLTELAASPEGFVGQVVKTEGEIAQVCQRMGCWMEMRAEGVAPVRVPMAGHSFFLPRDVAGRHAVVEGQLALRTLSAAEREHLESEGASATGNALEIVATGVVIR
ncbi:MAG: DUF4920 domain-containing protein [Sandaracinus sp.]|nr:DUF4920 domain-containing protein [Sandaracinus sp.]MCB9630933.1 DUF4920 domain-containing protein [Sandaracinus sp.]